MASAAPPQPADRCAARAQPNGSKVSLLIGCLVSDLLNRVSLEENCTAFLARFPPRARFRIHVLKESEFSARINFRVRQERFARVCLPNSVIACLVESVRVPIESAGAQRGDGARHGIAAHIDHFCPNVLAFLCANRVSNFTRETIVFVLRQAWADHPERAIAVVLQPMERRYTLR